MCGRYYCTADKSALQDVFKAVATGAAASYAPAYNIPPHSIQLIARQARDRATREIVPMRWGLIGHRTRGPSSTITPHIARVRTLSNRALSGANRSTNAAASSPRTAISNGCSLKVFPTASPSSIPKCSLLLVYGTFGRTLPTASGLRASPSSLPTATRFLPTSTTTTTTKRTHVCP